MQMGLILIEDILEELGDRLQGSFKLDICFEPDSLLVCDGRSALGVYKLDAVDHDSVKVRTL